METLIVWFLDKAMAFIKFSSGYRTPSLTGRMEKPVFYRKKRFIPFTSRLSPEPRTLLLKTSAAIALSTFRTKNTVTLFSGTLAANSAFTARTKKLLIRTSNRSISTGTAFQRKNCFLLIPKATLSLNSRSDLKADSLSPEH